MRQISRDRQLRFDRGPTASLVRVNSACDRGACSPAGTRHAAASADATEARRAPNPTASSTLPPAPAARTPPRRGPLALRRLRRRQQDDLRPPPPPGAVPLGLVHHQARALQVIQPALHAAAVGPHEPRTLSRAARHRTPPDHRRQPRDELPNRRRVPRRAGRMTEPEQVPLDRVRPRLQTIVTRRSAAAREASTREQGGDDQTPGLVRQRLARRPIPTARRSSTRSAVQRHRQRPKAPRQQAALRTRADARGTAETNRSGRVRAGRIWPRLRGWRSVRSAATVRCTCICERRPHRVALSGRRAAVGRPGCSPVFRVKRGRGGVYMRFAPWPGS
jgi:hypothetical protein